MALTIDIVVMILWLMSFIMIMFNKDRIVILLGSILMAYVSLYGFNESSAIFGFPEFIIMSWVISVIGIYRLFKEVK